MCTSHPWEHWRQNSGKKRNEDKLNLSELFSKWVTCIAERSSWIGVEGYGDGCETPSTSKLNLPSCLNLFIHGVSWYRFGGVCKQDGIPQDHWGQLMAAADNPPSPFPSTALRLPKDRLTDQRSLTKPNTGLKEDEGRILRYPVSLAFALHCLQSRNGFATMTKGRTTGS